MVKGIIIGHGDFAESMLKTAEGIVGKQQHVEIVSNIGLSCSLIDEKLKQILSESKEKETLVFVDLPGGSCTISCYNLLKEYQNLNIICGINLPILMEFFMLREKYSAKELADILVKKGKDNIFRLEHKK